jgi:hypothetical protein
MGIWDFLSLGALIIIAILIGRNSLFGGGLNRSPVVSLVCTGGELTSNDGIRRAERNGNPDLSMTLYMDLHYVQVHVTNNQPIEAPMTETEDDFHFESNTLSNTLFGDINRLTGRGRVYVTGDDGKWWHWDAVECARQSQRF